MGKRRVPRTENNDRGVELARKRHDDVLWSPALKPFEGDKADAGRLFMSLFQDSFGSTRFGNVQLVPMFMMRMHGAPNPVQVVTGSNIDNVNQNELVRSAGDFDGLLYDFNTSAWSDCAEYSHTIPPVRVEPKLGATQRE
jgi:hypothetical protein